MSLMNLTEELQLLEQELKSKFSLSFLESLARETGMIQRARKCKAQDIVSLCVFLSKTIGTESLASLCAKLNKSTGVSLSSEGLNQRFNSHTVQFFKQIFARLFHQNICPTPLIVRSFKRIRILDSTMFQLPNHYANIYKGFGGGGSEAGIKIQLEYDLLSGNFLQMDVNHAVSNDNTYGQTRTDTLEPGDLCIRDLGYFYIDDFKKMEEKRASYISRIRWNTQVYRKTEDMWELIDVEAISKQLKEGEHIEFPCVHIGFHQKQATRLIIYKLTESEHKKRLERHKKEKRRMPKYASSINLFITNIKETDRKAHEIYYLYSLRWQIEILFKTWKSILGIHAVKKIKLERFQCHLYGQLIALCLIASITYKMRRLIWERKHKETSEYKATYITYIYFPSILDVLFTSCRDMIPILVRLFEDLSKNGRKAHRYTKYSPFDILGITQEYTNSLQHTA
ncbi:IS4 family transposase [Bacillus cytotoxicus]|nr:IS4 family transposase [Bacillus cytotoxicus]